MNNNQDYYKFLGKLYDILLNEKIINYDDVAKDLKEKKIRVEKYLEKLQRVQDKSMDKDRYLNYIKELYYDKYVIKEENIPDNYLSFLERQYLEQGYGHINLVNPQNDIDFQMREEHIQMIIREQKDSLDNWLNYFLSRDSSYLPMWAKVWSFQGMLHIGNLNKNKDGYDNRSKTTVNSFVSMDSEILGKCVELVNESFNKTKLDDEELNKLLSSGSFQKIYGKLLANKKQIKVETTDGIWVKYNQEEYDDRSDDLEDDEIFNNKENAIDELEYTKLYNSLQGYNTGWCTAGSKETAKEQISEGDFYVYYSKDKDGEYKIPRLAIRMSGDEIAEIRGISEDQNIEPNMEDILEEKLKEFPNAKTYKKKVSDMKKLTKIYDKYKKGEELLIEDLKFLYEVNYEIEGFGYDKDPRVDEILGDREIIEDIRILPEILQVKRNLSDLISADGVVFPKKINYNLGLSRLKDAKGLVLPEEIIGDLNLCGLVNAENLVLPKKIDGDLDLRSLKSAKGLVLPEEVTGYLDLRGLISIEGLKLPKDKVDILNSSGLIDVKGMLLPPTKNIENGFDLSNLRDAKGLVLPEEIIGDLNLSRLKSIEGLKLPKKITGSLNLSGLIDVENLIFSEKIIGDLNLSGLKNVKKLVLPKEISGGLDLRHLEDVKELILPDKIDGDLNLFSLKYFNAVDFPNYIGGNLDLSHLFYIEKLKLPKKIGGDLNLCKLVLAVGIGLPEYIGGSLNLSALKSIEGLKFPDYIGDTLFLKNEVLFKEVFYKKINGIKQIGVSGKLFTLEDVRKREEFYKKYFNSKSKSRGFINNLYLMITIILLCVLAFIFALIMVVYEIR